MKGMIYTSFALLASALLLSLALVPLSTPEESSPSKSIRIGETSFFLDSVLQDLDRSLSLATRRALTSSTNYVLVNNESLAEPSRNISSALENGTISGEKLEGMQDVSMEAWNEKVAGIAENSGYSLNTSLQDYSFNATSMEIKTSYLVKARLVDPVTDVAFNRSRRANSTADPEGLDDPLLVLESGGSVTSQYRKCSFTQPLEKLSGATYGANGSVRGDAVVNPSNPGDVEDAGEKILVVDDVSSYDGPDVNSFEGVVSNATNSSSGYTNHYVFGTGSPIYTHQNQTLILDQDQVWRSDVSEMFENGGCYIEDSLGPDPVDRLGGELVNSDGTGIATVFDVSRLPPALQESKSAIGYVYFNESASYGGSERIEGLTDDYSWFRLDRDHLKRWNAEELVK